MENRTHCSRVLTCIQYPGVVNNENKAIETLGGITNLSKACCSSGRRLELKFRPKDPFCKVSWGNVQHTAGVLLKVRIKKKKSHNSDSVERKVVGTEVLGVVQNLHVFESLVDFQYLSLVPKDEKDPKAGLKYFLNEIIPPNIPDLEWMEKPVPYFFIPPIFSRMSTPQNYAYSATPDREKEFESKNIISRVRKIRSNFAIYINFNHTDPVPIEPRKRALENIANCRQLLTEVNKYFEQRSIWSRFEIHYISKIPNSNLQLLLPCVSYYYLNGPWRGLWVKFGYDPRKDPQSRIYQCIDFRLRDGGRFLMKKNNSVPSFTHMKDYNRIKQTKFSMKPVLEGEKSTSDKSNEDEYYLFRPDRLPCRRQKFYQFINLLVPEIQEMLSKLGEVLPGALCHERRGWLPSGFMEQCREIMNMYTNKITKQILQKQNSQSSPGCSTNPDGDKDDGSLPGGSNTNDEDPLDNFHDGDGLSDMEYDEDEEDDDVFAEDDPDGDLLAGDIDTLADDNT